MLQVIKFRRPDKRISVMMTLLGLKTSHRCQYVRVFIMVYTCVIQGDCQGCDPLDDVAGFQRRGQVMVLGDFNARVGSSACAFNVIGKYGEDHCIANGKRLIQLLHASHTYALNGRVRCPHPAWTRVACHAENNLS
jgi:hypothetical protein